MNRIPYDYKTGDEVKILASIKCDSRWNDDAGKIAKVVRIYDDMLYLYISGSNRYVYNDFNGFYHWKLTPECSDIIEKVVGNQLLFSFMSDYKKKG